MKKMQASEYRVKRIFMVFLLTGLAGFFIDLLACWTLPRVSGMLYEMRWTRSYISNVQFQGLWVSGVVLIVLLLPIQFGASWCFVRFGIGKRSRTIDMAIRCMRKMVAWKALTVLLVGFYTFFFLLMVCNLDAKALIVLAVMLPLYVMTGLKDFYRRELIGRAIRIGLLCPRCQYNLYRLTGTRCPECGLELEK